ncbi:hypothetical protein SAMN05216259_12831 [Actinacidiphila guanduensis]|uniref:Uncharacterized protein n=2 Tax=Actinacidiphila guanduensis TaxID=310781 RepID=A0A1H0SHP1_9ACTN|nr:hypothetical protein SAMN05216259_12831 [Actinacidiphila guanduensis]
MMNEDADGSLLSLPGDVVERVVAELSDQGEKAVAALRTAAVLIAQALHDETGLRFAESAAYNLREALDAVVVGRTPVPGGLPVVIEAWERFESEVGQPDNDNAASLNTFGAVLRRAAERQDRSSYHEAKLLGYLRDKSGVDPLPGDLDPILEYKRLRRATSQGLHRNTALESVTGFYQRTLAWFVRMFTPPDTIVLTLRALAVEPWRGPEQIVRLRELASNPHHLRSFFARLLDPAWLDPLYEAGAVPLPEPGTAWPVEGLLVGLGRTKPAAVAALAQRLLADAKRLPVERQVDVRFQFLVLAVGLGPAGNRIVGDVITAHPDNRSVRSLATSAVERCDPTDPVVERVGNAVLSSGPTDRDDYYYRRLLDKLESGMTPDNAEKRTRMVAAKLRNSAQQQGAEWISLDIARLTTGLAEDDRYFLVVVSHYLALLVARARELGVPSRRLLDWVTEIPGKAGERLTCRVLAVADDIPVEDKIEHVTRRLVRQTPTGDDQDLVDAVIAANPDPAQLAVWADALGSPSDPPADPDLLPEDWGRAWRWSAILPKQVLTGWEGPIAAVSALHGQIDPEAFGRRLAPPHGPWGQSPHSQAELAALPVLDAARLVAGWRPDADSSRRMTGARELATVLESVVAAEPQDWTEDAATVVETLREPLYVLHYFTALTGKAGAILSRTGKIIMAARYATTERWTPAVLGNDRFDWEPDWLQADTAVVDLITALADQNAPFAEHLDTAWSWAMAPIGSPAGAGGSTAEDPLHRAINSPRGHGLQAALSLAHWEYRNLNTIRPQFFEVLDSLLRITGPVGMEHRAILAWQRSRLELIAQDWLDRKADALFRDDDLGPATVDLTLKYGRPFTPWLHLNLRDDIIAAALRGTENAVPSLLTGTLNGEPGYDIHSIITALRNDVAVLSSAAEEMAFLVQNSSADTPQLDLAVEFWRSLLDANRAVVPIQVLRSTGRWAFVSGLTDSTWSSLTVRTLILTEGTIDYAIEVADRCATVPIPGDSTRILLLLQGRGEPWEQHHIRGVAINALRTLSASRADQNFLALRTRLIELGHDEAADLKPYGS